jgi:hypothetical protein
MGRLVLKITLMLGAAFLAGCSYSVSTGGSDTIDPARIEGTIARDLEEETSGQTPDLRVDSVTCPDGVKPAQGVTFECTAQLEGVQLPVKVTITQVDMGTGDFAYNWKPTKTVLILEDIVNAIKAAQRDQKVPNANVDCGTGRYRAIEIGGAMECTVSAGGERRVVRVVDDVDGGVHFEDG